MKLYKYISESRYEEVQAIPIPEGATNGDMIKAMFNCMVIAITNGKVYVEKIYFPFNEEWWNAPYKEVKNEHNTVKTGQP